MWKISEIVTFKLTTSGLDKKCGVFHPRLFDLCAVVPD